MGFSYPANYFFPRFSYFSLLEESRNNSETIKCLTYCWECRKPKVSGFFPVLNSEFDYFQCLPIPSTSFPERNRIESAENRVSCLTIV